jgi:hypothetical protein
MLKELSQRQMVDLWGQLWNQASVGDKEAIVHHLFSGHPPSYLTRRELEKCKYHLPAPHGQIPASTNFVELYHSIPTVARVVFLEQTIYRHFSMKSRQQLYRFLEPVHHEQPPTEEAPVHHEEHTEEPPVHHEEPHEEAPVDVPTDGEATETMTVHELPPDPSIPIEDLSDPIAVYDLPPHSEDDGEDIDFRGVTNTPPHTTQQLFGAPVPEETELEQIPGELELPHHVADQREEQLLKQEGDTETESDGTPSITPVGHHESDETIALRTEPAIEVMFNSRPTYFDACGACTEPAICHDGAGVGANQAICVQFCAADSDCQYKYQPKLHRSFPGLCLTHLGFCHGFSYAADKAGAILATQAVHNSWNQLVSSQVGPGAPAHTQSTEHA